MSKELIDGALDFLADETANSQYCKLPNGTLIQWGVTGSYVQAGGKYTWTVNLPVPFAQGSVMVGVASTRNWEDTDSYNINWNYHPVSTTQVQFQGYNIKGYSFIREVSWIVIGSWK